MNDSAMGVEGALVTLVIHTGERARRLKEILEFHGISVTVEPIETEDASLQAEKPVKVRIPESSLALGLKILESGDLSTSPLALIKMTGLGRNLLIPVDFSPASIVAVKVGFYFAEKFNVEPIIMHSYITPVFNPAEPYDDVMDDDTEAEAIEVADLRKVASEQLSKFKRQVERAQNEGTVAKLKFSTTLLEGIPEQVIQEYCKQNNPLMVVMATRGINKKEADLVGSVTAEVIDSCRVPVFTVPDHYAPGGIEEVKRIAMFCTMTNFDVVTIRGLMRMFDYPSCDLYLLPASDRPVAGAERKLEELREFLNNSFPTARFHTPRLASGKFDDRVRRLFDDEDIQLMIVPNKKTSALSRFFRPTLAHRILFDRDVPLLVLPV